MLRRKSPPILTLGKATLLDPPALRPAVASEVLYEVLCRGPDRCGMFVSAVKIDACPRCRSRKIQVRPVPASEGP